MYKARMRWWWISLVLLSSGCGRVAEPPSATPRSPLAPATELPVCPAVSEDPRVTRRNRLARELVELRASLALLPTEGMDTHPGSLRSKLRLAQLKLKSPGASFEVPMLAALQRTLADVDSRLEEEFASGRGVRHPSVMALVAARGRYLDEVERRRTTEQRETEEVLAKLTSDEARVANEVLLERYEDPAFTLERVASFDPMALRLLALQAIQLDVERAQQEAHGYGPRHPRVRSLDASRRALDRQFAQELEVFRAHGKTLKVLLSSGDPKASADANSFSTLGDRRSERARELADEIALLSIQIVQNPPERPAVGKCMRVPDEQE